MFTLMMCARRRSAARRSFALVATALAAGACHSYAPLATVGPQTGRETLAFDISDGGSVALADQIGPRATRVEGALTDPHPQDYVVRVSRVHLRDGSSVKWNGETVRLPRTFVSEVRQRRFLKGRTAIVVGGFAASVAAFVISRNLRIGGSGGDVPVRPPGGGGEQ
jgi:hypothetical protein